MIRDNLYVASKHTYEQCCGSEMFIPDADFYPSWIPDLGSRIRIRNTAYEYNTFQWNLKNKDRKTGAFYL
jgi:hypothetical protein